jgi:hypothetical protein
MNYVLMPVDYIEQLKANGKRKKARAFMEYFNDMQCEEENSYSFYAKSWEVSKSTAYAWVDEFNNECELFIAHWELKNKRHYSYVKNTAERQPNGNRTKITTTKPKNTDFSESRKTATERQSNKALNTCIVVGGDEKDKEEFATDGEFNTYYSELRFIAGKYAGNKDEAYKSYLKVKEFLNMKILVSAYKQYVKSVDVYKQEKIQGFKKFIDGEMYLAFLPKQIKVISELGVFEGYYENESLKTADGKYFGISHSKYLEFLKNQKIEFLEVA